MLKTDKVEYNSQSPELGLVYTRTWVQITEPQKQKAKQPPTLPKNKNKNQQTNQNKTLLTWILDRARYTLDFHSVFILRYCDDLEWTNCLL